MRPDPETMTSAELRIEVVGWRKSFGGHVYVKNEEYSALLRQRDDAVRHAEKAESHLGVAVALLREAKEWIYCATRFEQANRLRGRINAHLAACDKDKQ